MYYPSHRQRDWPAGKRRYEDDQPLKVVRVGQGDIAARLAAHRADPNILKYRASGTMFVTWAAVPAHQLDGVERFLANQYSPPVGDAFPNAAPIQVNLVA